MAKIKDTSDSGVQKEFLVNALEVSLFMTCCSMVNELRGIERVFRCGEITESVFQDRYDALLAQLTEAVAATERFDVVLPVIDARRFSPFFWRWYNWWDDYFKSLTPTQIGDIGRLARERMQAVNDHRPAGHWSTYRNTPGLTLAPTER